MAKSKRTEFTQAKQALFLAHVGNGMRRGKAAEAIGLHRGTVADYIEDHPEFEKVVLRAEDEANENVEEALYQAAISGNVAAARTWLELRAPERRGTQQQGAGVPPPPPGDDDELFPDNVTHMDPRSRRQSA